MSMFVFRNNTVERFFPEGYSFSGYDDISTIPAEATGYVWFFQAPVGYDCSAIAREIRGYQSKFDFTLRRIDDDKTVVALTIDGACATSFTENDFDLQLAIAEYNAALFDAEKRRDNLKVVDFSDFTRRYPAASLVDWKYYFIAKMGLNPKLAGDFQAWWNRKIEEIALKRKKCLVLDLDDVLWGGTLGEDGCNGIKIGGDYPGNAFSFFQNALLQLSKTGVILTVCSKNNERDALEAWEKNPFMVLKKEHFSARRVNWQDKDVNIREIAEELNIGLDDVVFVDDSPFERELVKSRLPMVCAPDFPRQPYEIPVFVQKLIEDYFKTYSITDEDRNKTRQYKENAARAQARRSFADMDEFLKSLDIRITIEAANQFNIPRIAQLTQKTNQFNLTTKRYTDADVRRFLSNGWEVWSLSVADKYGDSGITGCAVINGDCVDSFLLSCRILGRGLEFAFLKTIAFLMKKKGLRQLKGSYVPTLKNDLVKDFYEKAGFSLVSEENGRKEYVADLDQIDLKIKDYYHVTVVQRQD